MGRSNQLLGISCILIGMTVTPLMDAVIKLLSGGYPLHEIVMVRSAVAVLLTLIIVHFEGGLRLLKTPRPFMHLARGLLIAVANMAYYLAIAIMPLAEAAAIFFISPLLITALSVPLLGEKVGWRRWIAVAVGFFGVVVMMRIGTGSFNLFALLPVVAATGYALTQIITRKIGVTEKASVLSLYISLTFIVISAGFWLVAGDGALAGQFGQGFEFLFRAWRLPDARDTGLMIAVGFLLTIVGYMLSQAYRVAEANVVAPFEYIALPMAIMWGYVFWQEVPDIRAAIGIFLIVGSGVYVFIRERRETGPIDPGFGVSHGIGRRKKK